MTIAKPNGPWSSAEILTPNNTVSIANVPMALHAQSTGTINVRFEGSTSNVTLNVTQGNTYKYQIRYLYTNSTANIISLR